VAIIDPTTLLTQNSYGGLSKAQAAAALTSLYNQLQTNPANRESTLNQINEMFGSQIGQTLFNTLPGMTPTTPSTIGSGTAPTVPNVAPPLPPSGPTPSTTPTPSIDPLPSAPISTSNPAGGLFTDANPQFSNATDDINRILAEAELQKQLSGQTLVSQNEARQKYLGDLSSLLQKQQAEQLTTELPGVYEDLNTRGLLRSSALGNELGRRQSDLAKETSNKLALQGLNYNDLYTSGLGNIQNSYLGSRNSALQRRFSLEDLDTNIKASKDLGFALQPKQQEMPKNTAIPTAGIGAVGQIAAAGK